ncbi:hypothetical protein [Rhodoferax sp.]|uniref:hypothetical protein n=1 Tax=Rhodoferax sp. TaxID=50421 RepID=UPI0025E0DB8D|nr:hypothetical protein [Rhodoferax sp.]MCM2341365.1 hypothetical protein [Rhodoferax sp.]
MPDDFFACFGMSLDTWPIPQATVLVSDSINSSQFLFIGLPDGSLGLRVIRSGMHEDYETDIISPEGSFKIVASINYAPSRLSIQINGIEIECAPVGSREKGCFPLRSQSASAAPEYIAFASDIPPHATHAEALFIRTMGDLADAATSHDWYVLLKSSADLRLLLLDGLLHKANERHRLKVEFRVVGSGEPPPMDFDKLWNNIAPHDVPEELLKNVNLEQFLKLQVFESKNRTITVKDVIRAAANADGGVHFGNPERAEEGLVLILDKDAMRFGQAASRHMLRDICKVVVASSIPLVERIQRKPSVT